MALTPDQVVAPPSASSKLDTTMDELERELDDWQPPMHPNCKCIASAEEARNVSDIINRMLRRERCVAAFRVMCFRLSLFLAAVLGLLWLVAFG